MVHKLRGRVLIKDMDASDSVEFGEAGSGVTIENEAVPLRRARLNLSSATLSVDADDDYGSLKLLDLPDRNIMIFGVEADLVLTKEGNMNGILAATDLDVGIGTAAASSTTLATTMIDVLEKTDIDTNALAVDYHASTQAQSTAATPLKIVDSATAALYLNAVAIGGITADSSLSCSGLIDIYYLDLGNLSS